MTDWPLRLYHLLPPSARSLAATARGCYLNFWRYGASTQRLIEEALERETWSPRRWKMWQEERLAYVLHRAATRVPYYRQQWAERRRRGDSASWQYLENWPVLEKDFIRSAPRSFMADDCRTERMYEEHTSGTTGKPLTLWSSRKTVQSWYALFELRCRNWYGVSRHNRWAILGGQLVTPVQRRRPPFWVWNAAMHQLYMSSYHLAPDLVPYYLDAIRKYRIKYLWGYSSSLATLAQEALHRGGVDFKLHVAITNAEPLFQHQKEAIAKAFGCPAPETYGQSEMVAAATECASGRLHIWPEVGFVEIAGENGAQKRESIGDLICTGLLNADMPLIRYRVGDRAALGSEAGACACGRTLPVLRAVEGRTDDMLFTSDGRSVGRLDPVFKADLRIREAQIIQETLDRIKVCYVPAPGFSASAGRSMIERLRDRMGPVAVDLEEVDRIPRSSNGKFRAVICKIPAQERQQLNNLNSRGSSNG